LELAENEPIMEEMECDLDNAMEDIIVGNTNIF